VEQGTGYLTRYRPAMPLGNRKKYFRGSFQFSIVTIKKKYISSGNLKFHYLGIFQSLKLRIFVKKIISICHQLISLQILWAIMG